MNITLEQSGVTALITVKMEKADYQDAVKKELKNISAKAEMPGFRPGKVPTSVIQKRFGAQVKADQVNRMLGEKLMGYIQDNKMNILGEPMMSEKQQPQDIEKQDDFEFLFDIALAPEFKVELTADDMVDFYDIEVTDEQVDGQVKNFAQQAGHPENVESYEERDILRGALAEQDADGNVLEGGINIDKASLMPAYFKNDEQKAIFAGAKVNDVITFNPFEAHSENEFAALIKVSKEEAGNHKGNFTFQVEEISRFVPAEMNEEFFDRIFEPGTVKTEEEFRAKVKELMQTQHVADSDYKFLLDVRKYAEEKVGELEFPLELLKRFMKEQNADKGEEYVEKNFDKSIEELKWHLIKEQLVGAQNIKVDNADVKAQAIKATRFQFMQYGMNNVPEEYLEQYAAEMLKKGDQVNGLVERCIDEKLAAALKNVVKLNRKSVSVEEFQKLFEN
ncbi:trigger factor [Alloprevotella sp. OH1205_COT-284]|uniref:trigger factor n=1 Tax=Alloprevotella sp. OH1205_COT-284 TaxID=2491043 RepID=UPI000F5F7AC1|nr:trigger factor [Alloprevotella sp. OH1205_COT-284]RRD79344.1 trigger factor [Alloprevotella sp. OH1205_COT-284]